MKYTERLALDLKRLGIVPGDVVLMHTSLKALDTPGLRAEDVIETLLELLTPAGTLLVPALSYLTVTRENPVFDIKLTKSCIGALPECFRTQYAQYRSVHPTHSVCAWGRYAYSVTAWHKLDETPVGPHSPFMQLPMLGGKLLMLGCGLRPNTFMHGVEEAARASYPLDPKYCLYTLRDAGGRVSRKMYHPHSFGGLVQRYDRLADLLPEPALIKGRVLGGSAYLIDAKAALEAGTQAIRKKDRFFVDDPGSLNEILKERL